ncbi:MAG: type II secretion system minor pseudopilin GspK [Dokdonella sp.]
MSRPHSQRGVALLIALLAVALAVILIASLLDRGELAFARTRNALRGEQAVAYSEGLEAYAAHMLMRDRDEEGEIDTSADIWALPLPPQEVPGGRISARLVERNGCFNLNNLASASDAGIWRTRMRNLLTALELDPSLAAVIEDWVDGDTDPSANGGAEDSAYAAQAVAYRSANRAMAHVSELRLVRGVSGEVYARLAPHVCVLPVDSKLNLNTATTPVLMSLDSRITVALAERIRQDGQARWKDVKAVLDELQTQNIIEISQRGLGVTSHYFLARAEIILDDVPFTLTSLLERRTGVGVSVLSRARGSDDDAGSARALRSAAAPPTTARAP